MRVFIDPGHGGKDPGAVYGRLKEKEIVFSVASLLYDKLEARGNEVRFSRVSDYYVYNTHRAMEANDWGADIFVSIHTNADPDEDNPGDPEAKGTEIWIYPGSEKGRMLALCLAHAIPEHFPGRRFRGIKEARFTVLSKTQMPAVLIEVGFLDTDESSKLDSLITQDTIARCIADGLEDYFTAEDL